MTLPDEHGVSLLRWWYQDQNHGRWEVETVEPALMTKTLTVVDDGQYEWSYDSLSNTYQRADLIPLPPGVPRNVAMSILIGPAPWPTLKEVIKGFEGWNQGQGTVKVVGHEEFLGRLATIIEIDPISHSSDSNGNVTGSGVGRFWLDESSMMILKVTGTAMQAYTAEVTRLDLGVNVAVDKLKYSPPAGARERPAHSYSSNGRTESIPPLNGPHKVVVPAGFLSIDTPGGWRQVGTTGTDTGAGEPGMFGADFINDAGQYLQIQQQPRRDGLPAGLKSGQAVRIDGITAYQATKGGTNLLAFERDGISVVVASNGLTFEELEALAAQMTLVR